MLCLGVTAAFAHFGYDLGPLSIRHKEYTATMAVVAVTYAPKWGVFRVLATIIAVFTAGTALVARSRPNDDLSYSWWESR